MMSPPDELAATLVSEWPPRSVTIEALNAYALGCATEELLALLTRCFGAHVAASSSFQTQSVPLLYMISRAAPQMDVLFLDTGFHFAETLAFRDSLAREWGLNIKSVRREATLWQISADLPARDPDYCCYLNKVEPMQRALRNYRVWITGVRKDQTTERSDLHIVEWTGELLRVHPMAQWSEKQVADFIAEYKLPSHPLTAAGYRSIGCAPCTLPTADAADARAGRWTGLQKNECGLHTNLRKSDK